ncbi:tRNA lysidine(34) synthetase TilS [Paenibacillus caseinilyticus]|uniref:tRNA(Ile)-lysidine synthase n=1 Tax=Paenibacillus mucilaginosus K02 TaxID=997761 RepID=I0BUI8_9BACL|nr:tRNA lysidine(34) synthetase TilS [Paenibacillus mucilaginosus]AFH66035.1 tRNA(Ile)-lysidine synthetase [Paenibacillus mucilaginosus K02]
MRSGAGWPARVEKWIRKEALLAPGDGVVVAVSGGPDSVGLLHLLFGLSARYEWRLIVAHVNHGFRAEESERESELVARHAARLGLALHTVRLDMPSVLAAGGENPQAAARERRYAFLLDVARRTGARRIATAHHADDQAETVLMRILRGTGLSGLAGIPLRRTISDGVELIRPLLRIYKSEIEAYCEAEGLEYCTDSSNLQAKYTRNQVRLELMPYLKQYNDKLPEALVRLAETAGSEDSFLEEQTRLLYEANIGRRDGAYVWSARWFAGVHIALQRRLIKLILSYLAADRNSMDFLHIESVRLAILSEEPVNFRREVVQDIMLAREYDRIAVHTMVLPPRAYVHELGEGLQSFTIPETGVRIELQRLEGEDPVAGEAATYTAIFDAEELFLPLIVRSRLPGDRMQPLGLNGTKKVKDMFIDAKVPPSLRERIPLITDARGNIIWVPGVRTSAMGAVTASTRSRLRLRLVMPN